ncbi:hypothetical protein ACY05_03165 [Sterolibacterium denitrificans]|uniref:Uncharacterized protein n=1 Tax=Sterolibacterium denitrificans TaxID=157592 RepID=A0A656Z960_9PROT|nr:hypothetical protein ACY05_03165 [Sterolibacterium denitrificans]
MTFSGQCADIVLVYLALDLKNCECAKNDLPEPPICVVFNKTLAVSLFGELMALLKRKINRAYHDVPADISRGCVDTTKIQSKPIIAWLSIVIDTDTVSVDANTTAFIKKILNKLTVSQPSQDVVIAIEYIELALHRPDAIGERSVSRYPFRLCRLGALIRSINIGISLLCDQQCSCSVWDFPGCQLDTGNAPEFVRPFKSPIFK